MFSDDALETLATLLTPMLAPKLAKLLEQPAAPTRWLDAKLAADYLCLTEEAVRSKVKRREIPYHRIGRSLRFDTAELDAFVRGG